MKNIIIIIIIIIPGHTGIRTSSYTCIIPLAALYRSSYKLISDMKDIMDISGCTPIFLVDESSHKDANYKLFISPPEQFINQKFINIKRTPSETKEYLMNNRIMTNAENSLPVWLADSVHVLFCN